MLNMLNTKSSQIMSMKCPTMHLLWYFRDIQMIETFKLFPKKLHRYLNARNVSFGTLNGAPFKLSTQLLNLNHPVKINISLIKIFCIIK